MNIAFQVEDLTGAPVTGLTISRVKFYSTTTPFGEVAYTTLTEVGSQGNYVADGFTDYDEVILKIDGTEQTWFGKQPISDGNIPAEKITSGTLAVARLPSGIDATKIGSGNITNAIFEYLVAVTSDIQAQLNSKVGKTGAENIAGIKTFLDSIIFSVDTGVSPAKYPQIASAENPTNDLHLVPLFYFNQIMASITGVVQSQRAIYCLADRTADNYSKKTLEACVIYLQALTTALTSKYRGLILLHPSNDTGNELTAGGSLWFGNYIDIFSFGLSKIIINNSGTSLTGACKLSNIRLVDTSEKTSQTFTNFTFDNCEIDNADANYTFNNCVINGLTIKGNATVSLASCKGKNLLTNCTVTQSGTGRVHNVFQEVSADDLF